MRGFLCSRGSVTGLTVLVLPALIVGLAGLADVGAVALARVCVQSAADLAALAAVQEVDLERLAEGERLILVHEAKAAASEYAESNLHRLNPMLADNQTPQVRVDVYNASVESPIEHPGTRRVLTDPTVCVSIEARIRLPMGLFGRSVRVRVSADATVLGPQG